MMANVDYGTCECCGQEPAIGVAAVPGIPMSIAWGKKCLDAGVIPYGLAVANTVCIGGLDGANDAWKELVELTVKYFDKTMEEFNRDVQQDLETISSPSGMSDEFVESLMGKVESLQNNKVTNDKILAALDAIGLTTTYVFFRKDKEGKEFWYPIEGIEKPEQVKDHVDLNPGTIRVEDIFGTVIWPAK